MKGKAVLFLVAFLSVSCTAYATSQKPSPSFVLPAATYPTQIVKTHDLGDSFVLVWSDGITFLNQTVRPPIEGWIILYYVNWNVPRSGQSPSDLVVYPRFVRLCWCPREEAKLNNPPHRMILAVNVPDLSVWMA